MPFRILQVGCGARGRMWDTVIHRLPDAAVAAYVDIDLDAARAFAEPRGRPAFRDLSEALREMEVDAVLLATPPFGRLEQVETVSTLRLPILAEKPLADTFEEAVQIVKRAESTGGLTVSMQFRYLPVTQTLRRLLLQMAYGRPGFGHFVYLRNRDGAAPGLNRYPLNMQHPMLLEQTIHHYDLIRYCYDSEPVWIQAHAWNPSWSMYAHDSNVMTAMRLTNGVTVHYLGTWTAGWDKLAFEWRTDCDRGILTQRSLFGDLFAALREEPDLKLIQLERSTPFFDDTEQLLHLFAKGIATKRSLPCGGWDHLRSLAMVFAAIESSETGHRVYMRDFFEKYGLLGCNT